jgi:NAD(P)-dependent dehydrogenase (short-subunit alcohol dehydrogenase family)
VVERALAIVDHLDILVNNGGMLQRADSVDVKVEEWDYVSDSVLRISSVCSVLTLGSECELELALCDLSSRRKTLYP